LLFPNVPKNIWGYAFAKRKQPCVKKTSN